MLRKLLALATTTAMLGANAAAYAVNSVRAAAKSVTGSPAAEENPQRVDGRTIQPSIPPLPPVAEPRPEPPPMTRKVSAKKPEANHGASKNFRARTPKEKSARQKSRRAK